MLRIWTTPPLFVTLSKAGSTALSIETHGKTPAASNFRAWREPKRKAGMSYTFALPFFPFRQLLKTFLSLQKG